MKKIVMLTMLLVSASTFMMAQTPIEQAREKAKALIKGRCNRHQQDSP